MSAVAVAKLRAELPRLLVVTNDFPPRAGGIQKYVATLTDRYPGPSLILAPWDERATPTPGLIRSPRSFLWPTPGAARWICEQAAHFQPGFVLFAASWPLALLGPRLRSALGAPYGILGHGAEITVPAGLPLARRAIRSVLRSADVVFANGRHTARAVDELGAASRFLGMGVDARAFRPAERRPGGAVVGTVGRFVPRKGQARVLRAVATLRARGLDAEALVVGTGRLEARLRGLASRLGVPTRFEIDPPWDRLPDLYRQMDVFALPCRSRWAGLESEGLGIVLLEAAASGLPVVAGDSGGAPETVRSGETGFVVREARELEAALERLIVDPHLAARMGAAGRAWVEKAFAWSDVLDRFVEAIRHTASMSTAAARRATP